MPQRHELDVERLLQFVMLPACDVQGLRGSRKMVGPLVQDVVAGAPLRQSIARGDRCTKSAGERVELGAKIWLYW